MLPIRTTRLQLTGQVVVLVGAAITAFAAGRLSTQARH
jgi:hypothetical protein